MAFAVPAFGADTAIDQPAGPSAQSEENQPSANPSLTRQVTPGMLSENGRLAHMDRRFFDRAAEDGTNEIALSQLVAGHSSNQYVKAYAEMIIDQHTKLNDSLSRLAQRQGVDLTEYIEKGQQEDVNSLQGEHGKDFDKDYLEAMIKGHEAAVDLFQHEASNSMDSALGTFAVHNIGKLLTHLRKAKALYRDITGDTP
ncbi:MAG: DUF4142 domain-containing protein [Opitutaceae bacterium]